MDKTLRTIITCAVEGNRWQKFTNPTVPSGRTIWPKTAADQERMGVRFDYDKEVERDGVVYHKIDMQPNAGKVPASIKAWREANGGTHAVMASAYVKKEGTENDVVAALRAAAAVVRGS